MNLNVSQRNAITYAINKVLQKFEGTLKLEEKKNKKNKKTRRAWIFTSLNHHGPFSVCFYLGGKTLNLPWRRHSEHMVHIYSIFPNVSVVCS